MRQIFSVTSSLVREGSLIHTFSDAAATPSSAEAHDAQGHHRPPPPSGKTTPNRPPGRASPDVAHSASKPRGNRNERGSVGTPTKPVTSTGVTCHQA